MIQAKFINGALILVIYLHHVVADTNGMSTNLMSEGLPPRKFDHYTLDSEATAVSQGRSRLSNYFETGAPAFLSLAKDIYQQLEQTRQPQQRQFHHDHGDTTFTDASKINDRSFHEPPN